MKEKTTDLAGRGVRLDCRAALPHHSSRVARAVGLAARPYGMHVVWCVGRVGGVVGAAAGLRRRRAGGGPKERVAAAVARAEAAGLQDLLAGGLAVWSRGGGEGGG